VRSDLNLDGVRHLRALHLARFSVGVGWGLAWRKTASGYDEITQSASSTLFRYGEYSDGTDDVFFLPPKRERNGGATRREH